MILHESPYEKDGWIPIERELPPAKKSVRLAHVIFHDWNLESLKWETTGWYRDSGIWSLTRVKGYSWGEYGKPTHWKLIE